jgi:hypothetical protein
MDISFGRRPRAFRVSSLVVVFLLLPFLLLPPVTPVAVGPSTTPPFLLRVSAGVYRPSDATFYLRKTNASGVADVAITYGIPGDVPIAGDWNGNGIDTVGVYRDGEFCLHNSNTSGYADAVVPYGLPGDQPVVGDWDNNGTATVGIYRGNEFFVLIGSSREFIRGFWLGMVGDVPLAGNWGLPEGGVAGPHPAGSCFGPGRLRSRGLAMWQTEMKSPSTQPGVAL